MPAGWQEVPGGQFLVAKFNLTGDSGATAAVNVSSSPGEGGGLAGNVNRWRGQLGLEKLSDADVTAQRDGTRCARRQGVAGGHERHRCAQRPGRCGWLA